MAKESSHPAQITGLLRVNSQIKLQPWPVDFRWKGRVQLMEYANTKRPGTPARCEKRVWEGLDQNPQHRGFKAVGVQIRHDFCPPCERTEFVSPCLSQGSGKAELPGWERMLARCAGAFSLV